ncbi:hypothetical protein CHS0354_037510 [Potamilus streckersoni]|uniref:C1q domain-containing protein n=1 Tax=Potamilus streckersoni TaxID=2493646 RepID=A0AAE0VHL3_9BIVA|nr:hypothetical protein CHS0354_037510 [Potamilus streckersoni]
MTGIIRLTAVFLFSVYGFGVSLAQTTIPTRSSRVAFSVGLTYTMHLSFSETVLYDKIFTNLGNGYNKQTGVFTCPVEGIYLFHLHAYDMNTDKAMWLELMHNDDFIVSVSGYASHSSGGNTVILHLRIGDKIQVKGREQQQFSLFGQQDEIYSTLSGFLLYPDDTSLHGASPIVG